MRVTLKPQPSKAIIIDRLYSRRAHNPEDSHHGITVGVRASAKQDGEESMLLSGCNERVGQFKHLAELDTQPSSNVYRPVDERAQSQDLLLNSHASTFSVNEPDPFQAFSKLRVRYQAVDKPEGALQPERSLLSQLYQLQRGASKPSSALVETAHFGGPRVEANCIGRPAAYGRGTSQYDSLASRLQQFKSKYQDSKVVARETAQFVPKPVQNQPYLYPSYQNSRKPSAPRRSKTECSLLREGHNQQRKQEGQWRADPQGSRRAFSHNFRYLRPVARVQTERAMVEDRQAGAIRRQSSSANLFHNQVRDGQENAQEASQRKLEQIRQQLHQIYHSRNTSSQGNLASSRIMQMGRPGGQGGYNPRLLLERSRNGPELAL